METAEKIAQAIKETVEGVGEGALHGMKVAAGMESGGTQTIPTIPVSSGTAIPVRESTMGREHPNPVEVSTYLNAAKATQSIDQPKGFVTAESVSPIEALKENIGATGEKIKELVGLGVEKGEAAGKSMKESVKEAGAKTSETVGEGLKGAGETTKHVGERATGERTRI